MDQTKENYEWPDLAGGMTKYVRNTFDFRNEKRPEFSNFKQKLPPRVGVWSGATLGTWEYSFISYISSSRIYFLVSTGFQNTT